jgi:hypothetical protein
LRSHASEPDRLGEPMQRVAAITRSSSLITGTPHV